MAIDYTNDLVLLEGLKKQDIRAYEFLYLSSRNRLYVLAEYIVHDQEVAKDLTHEFLADFWEQKLYGNVKHSLKSYLYNAMRNRAISYLRGEKAYLRVIEGVAGSQQFENHFPLENEELKRALEFAIDNLPKKASTVFKMQYLENMSQIEIASKLGISRYTVSNHIDRALKELRVKLKAIL